ncbi:ankyrin repeat domain-containing protein [Achromobacter sp. MY14]|uniref:ankyrin repeat domain-containing protein n=1 Tax=unclassified Achromobacter TaxID=2626865 RepID=UPI001E3519E7|nr:ankyrin repeat domain-containing protein [Achromobacter sp. MY14]MCD0496795.1 ankyrin repeat domain-containing protein [Achromobacter sp. MY14]
MNYNMNLSIAAITGDIDAAADAVKHGADIDNDDGQALIEAIRADDLRMVHALTQLGANVNGIGGKPLAEALERRNTDIALYLVEHGANHYEAAIDLAIVRDRTDYLQTLTALGATIQATEAQVSLALDRKASALVLMLMEHGYELTEAQVLKVIYLELHQVIKHLTHHTGYLPTQELRDSLMGSRYEWFLHGIANRELYKTLTRNMTARAKEQVRKI